MKRKVLVLLADGFEEIEAITSIDVLRRAGLSVTVAGVGKKTVRGSRGVTVKTDIRLSLNRALPDAVLLPGGMPGVQNLSASREVNKLIVKAANNGKVIAAICAAPSHILVPTGVLDGKKATCYPGCEGLLKGRARYVDKKVVTDGDFITSQGPGTAFDFALTLVGRLRGSSVEKAVRKKILYGSSKK